MSSTTILQSDGGKLTKTSSCTNQSEIFKETYKNIIESIKNFKGDISDFAKTCQSMKTRIYCDTANEEYINIAKYVLCFAKKAFAQDVDEFQRKELMYIAASLGGNNSETICNYYELSYEDQVEYMVYHAAYSTIPPNDTMFADITDSIPLPAKLKRQSSILKTEYVYKDISVYRTDIEIKKTIGLNNMLYVYKLYTENKPTIDYIVNNSANLYPSLKNKLEAFCSKKKQSPIPATFFFQFCQYLSNKASNPALKDEDYCKLMHTWYILGEMYELNNAGVLTLKKEDDPLQISKNSIILDIPKSIFKLPFFTYYEDVERDDFFTSYLILISIISDAEYKEFCTILGIQSN